MKFETGPRDREEGRRLADHFIDCARENIMQCEGDEVDKFLEVAAEVHMVRAIKYINWASWR